MNRIDLLKSPCKQARSYWDEPAAVGTGMRPEPAKPPAGTATDGYKSYAPVANTAPPFGPQSSPPPGTTQWGDQSMAPVKPPAPKTTPLRNYPVFDYAAPGQSGQTDVRSAEMRYSLQPREPYGLPQFTNGIANMATDQLWNQVLPYRRRPLGNNPFSHNPMTQYVPPQYRNAEAAALHAMQNMTPYENGLTPNAQMMVSAVPYFMQHMNPEWISRMQNGLSGLLR